jgi:HTH-type transcriptional regulator/antitoxin HipB
MAARTGRAYRVYGARTLGPAIRELRHARDLSQAELAAKAGVHRTYLSNLEQGNFSEQVRRLFEVFSALEVEVTLTPRDDEG